MAAFGAWATLSVRNAARGAFLGSDITAFARHAVGVRATTGKTCFPVAAGAHEAVAVLAALSYDTRACAAFEARATFGVRYAARLA